MKKYINVLMLLAVVVFGLCSCEDDKDPVLQKPTEFVLNTPATANLYYNLTPSGTLNLTFSQPNYGPGIIAHYFVQVALDEAFAEGKYVQLSEEYATCSVNVPESSIAEAVCKLRGVTSEDNYTDEPARKVYFRVLSQVSDYLKTDDAASYDILSNVVVLNQVKEYFALKLPGKIYLVGSCSGWNEPSKGNADKYVGWTLEEAADQIDSKIYTGVFDIPAGQFQFRFYSALTGWDAGDSVGSQADDNPVDIDWIDGVGYSGSVVKGKGSFQYSSWAGGKVKIVVNLKAMTVEMTPVTE